MLNISGSNKNLGAIEVLAIEGEITISHTHCCAVREHGFIPRPQDRGVNTIAGIDFINAIVMHMAWRRKIEECLLKKDLGNADLQNLYADDHCELGQWMHGEGMSIYGVRDDFHALISDHAHFHLAAGDLIDSASSRSEYDQEKMQEFLLASELILTRLTRLYISIVKPNDLWNSIEQKGYKNELSQEQTFLQSREKRKQRIRRSFG